MKHRKLYKKQCKNKEAFSSELLATIQAMLYNTRLSQDPILISEYFCKWCHYWHVGHTPYEIRKIQEKANN